MDAVILQNVEIISNLCCRSADACNAFSLIGNENDDDRFSWIKSIFMKQQLKAQHHRRRAWTFEAKLK